MLEILQYDFMRNALIATLLASVACGVVGCYVVVKRIVSISGGIAHAAFGGVGIAYFLKINPIIGVVPFSLLCALGIGCVTRKNKLSEDSAVGIFWAIGMSIGIIFLAMVPGYVPDLFGYLFGSILTISSTDIVVMFVMDIIILAIIAAFYKEFLALCFDEVFLEVSGKRASVFYFLLLGLIAVTIVVLMKIVGIILVIALLTIPASIARHYTSRLLKMMVISCIVSVGLTLCGLLVSYLLNLPSSAVIILVFGAAYLVSLLVKRVLLK